MSVAPAIVWFRADLRLQDNPALHAAIARGGAIVPVFIFDDAVEGDWPVGAASCWWLHHSLAALGAALRERGSRLILARGEASDVIVMIAKATGATAVCWNCRSEPAAIARDAMITTRLVADGIEVENFNGALLHEPSAIKNQQGRPYQVFTPYWRHCLTLPVAAPLKLGRELIVAPKKWPRSLALDELELKPRIPWDAGFGAVWQPGEASARKRLAQFATRAMTDYATARDRPAQAGTSQLSAALHFGELSPRQIWAAVAARGKESGVFPPNNGARIFLAEIGWREFAHHLLFHFPTTPTAPLREAFEYFPWASDPGRRKLRTWQRGRTGYPIVDAGMRQLWSIGWMHNRVRMIVASFLVKHLRLSWTHGAAWFWDTLIDADLANNTLGWQWSAGCGADASPYFRIFAPVLQGRKFDAAGDYVRRWVPELAKLPTEYLHAPWEAPAAVLAAAGVTLGETYPRPIVDHATVRAEALAALKQMRALA